MKLRLSHALFRAVMACFLPAVTLGLSSVSLAANLHSSPTIQEYTDIAEGRGIYRFAYGASLIAYKNGEPTYELALTPTFTSTCDSGTFTLVNNGSFQLTVEHNGIMTNNTFSARYVGQNAQKYSGVGIRYVDNFSSGAANDYVYTGTDNNGQSIDYRVERVTRLVTDATSAVYCQDETLLGKIGHTEYYPEYEGMLIFRVGGGTNGIITPQGEEKTLTEGYYGLTAGISSFGASFPETTKENETFYQYHYGISSSYQGECGESCPLPSSSRAGDSGSPLYIYKGTSKKTVMLHMRIFMASQVW